MIEANGINQNQLEVIRFIEAEFEINEIIEDMIDTHSIEEINEITEPIFKEIAHEISATLNIPLTDGAKLYARYMNMMAMVAQVSMLTEDIKD